MPDEPTTPTAPAEPTEPTTPTEPTEPAPPDRVAELEAKVREYESKFLTPEYADFLRHRAGLAQQQPQQQQPQRKQWTQEERQAFEERLDSLSKGEFAAYIRDAVVEKVREELFAPLARDIVQSRVQQDIAATAAKYPDFGTFRDDMIVISNANPSLGAEQVYLLAKAQRSGQVPTPTRPTPILKPSGEVPGGSPATPTPKKPIDFKGAFEDAFKKSGFSS